MGDGASTSGRTRHATAKQKLGAMRLTRSFWASRGHSSAYARRPGSPSQLHVKRLFKPGLPRFAAGESPTHARLETRDAISCLRLKLVESEMQQSTQALGSAKRLNGCVSVLEAVELIGNSWFVNVAVGRERGASPNIRSATVRRP